MPIVVGCYCWESWLARRTADHNDWGPPGSGWGSLLSEMAGGSTVAWVGNLVDHNEWVPPGSGWGSSLAEMAGVPASPGWGISLTTMDGFHPGLGGEAR